MRPFAGNSHRAGRPATGAAVLSIVIAVLLLPAAVSGQPPGQEVSPPAAARFTMPDPAAVREAIFALIEARQADPSIRRAAEAIWAEQTPGTGWAESGSVDVLDRVARTVALVDDRVGRLAAWSSEGSAADVPETAWLRESDLPGPIAASLRLYAARAMVHRQLYDEAAELLGDLSAEQVFDPWSLWFYQAAVYHQLVRRKEALQAADQLLAGAESAPRRFVALARLIKADLQSLQKGSLDHIARQMNNSSRYLELGRADDQVQKLQKEIVDALDKLVEQLEQAEQSQAAASAGAMQPARPAEESRPLGGRGPGEVTKRPIGSQSGWGNLPPKEREEAMQQIGRRFPAHYREIIEQYFRRLASEEMP